MKKFMILGTVVALVVVALALPALAQDGIFKSDEDRFEARQDRFEERFGEDFFFGEEGFFFGEDGFFFDEDRFEDDDLGDDDAAAGISQSFDQQAESGDVSQSFNVTGGGDNSNQCVGIQGGSNTGNAQNQVGVIQYGSEADDFSFEDSGASINVSPTNSTSCDQQGNQAAISYYGGGR